MSFKRGLLGGFDPFTIGLVYDSQCDLVEARAMGAFRGSVSRCYYMSSAGGRYEEGFGSEIVFWSAWVG